MSGIPAKWYDPEFPIHQPGSPATITSKRELPGGKTVDLGIFISPDDHKFTEDPRLRRKPRLQAEIRRPVVIERFHQLMLLYVNDIYVDVFLAPGAAYDVTLSEEQQARITEALETECLQALRC